MKIISNVLFYFIAKILKKKVSSKSLDPGGSNNFFSFMIFWILEVEWFFDDF
jgi:hypothetical protein